jgi:hypothetical protein
MTTLQEAFDAGIDAVIADNSLNRGGFVDAMQTVISRGLSNAEGNAFVDAVAVFYEQNGIINNPTYNNLRNEIVNEGADVAKRLFLNLGAGINALPEAVPVNNAARLQDLREDRDQIDAGLTRLDELIAVEPPGTVGRFVKDILRQGKQQLRQYKQEVRDQIQNLTGNPDS